jgi:predicted RNA-binding protein YlqC (UPF0109 family)
MNDFVVFIASHLVDNPEKISLEQEDREDKIVFRLHVAEHDVGKVIGKKGRTAQSLRILLAAVAARQGKRAILEIAE